MSRQRTDLLDPAFLARLERLELNVRRIVAGERRGEVATRRRGPGTLFRDHRPYVAGDDPRFLDWNAYLRLDDLQVKEFEAEESPRLLLLVDRSASMGLRQEAKLGQALRLAAALGAVGLMRQVTTTCATFPGTEPPTFRGRTALFRLLEHLASTTPAGEAQFLPAFQVAAPRDRPSGIAVVISDFFETEQHGAALRFLRHRGYRTHAVHVMDRRDRNVRAGDVAELVDVETGRKVRERLDRKLAAAYREALAAHFRQIEEVCRSLQVSYIGIDVEDPMERIVMDLLRRGALVA
ncbi:MAG: hypothetical protein CMJ83_04750 [Planctomycetes bacterium]|jgi:uncharacterized protein (DUF58 family)|nr:hypothetical protein [Planctomycetota bacterium]